MALINPGTLLNIAAEATRPDAGLSGNKGLSSMAAEPFSRTLRQHMQQGAPGQAAESRKTVSSVAGSAAQRKEAAAEGSKPAQAEANPVQQPDEHHAGPEVDGSQPVARETAPGRKKRQVDDTVSAQDMAGPPAWVQTVMAMRGMPDAALATANAVAAAVTAALPTMAGVAVPLTAAATETQTNDSAFTAGTRSPPLTDTLTAAMTESGADGFKAVWTAQSDGQPVTAMADADQAVAAMATAVQGDGHPVAQAVTEQALLTSELPGDIAASVGAERIVPAALVIPNSAWLNAAGVAPQAAVLTAQMLTPFGHERWQAAMNQHVAAMAGAGDEVASLTLSPPDLGPIQVVLKVDNQSVNTSFITDNPLVRQALEDGMQDLRQRMQSQGLQLGQTFVGDGRQAQQHFESQPQRQTTATVSDQSSLEAAAVAPATPARRVALGRVDTFV